MAQSDCKFGFLNWCNEFGLLGIYPLRLAIAAHLQGTIGAFPALVGGSTGSSEPGSVAAIPRSGPVATLLDVLQQVTEDTGPALGDRFELIAGSGKTAVMLALACRAELVEAVRADNEWMLRGCFSSAVPITAQNICTPAYWLGYSEPLDSFIAYAWRFLDAASVLAGVNSNGASKRLQPGTASAEYLSGLANVAPRYAINNVGVISETEWAPSLLSSFARMLLDDHYDVRRVHLRCETCNRMRKYRDRKQSDGSSKVRHEN